MASSSLPTGISNGLPTYRTGISEFSSLIILQAFFTEHLLAGHKVMYLSEKNIVHRMNIFIIVISLLLSLQSQ